MRFRTPVKELPEAVAAVRDMRLFDQPFRGHKTGRTILKGGRIIDPVAGLDMIADLAFLDGRVERIGQDLRATTGDVLLDVRGLLVIPGLVDMHLHLYDLALIGPRVMEEAAVCGVTTALSPGAGNTVRATSFLGSELDRGSLINMGCYIGAPGILAFDLDKADIVRFLRGEMPEDEALQKIARNRLAARTGPLAVGLKDHQAHMILSPRQMKFMAEVAQDACLLFMSHTQCPSYAQEIVRWAEGRPVHLGHMDASGSGSHGPGPESIARVISLVKDNPNVTGEFTSTFLRASGGDRDGLVLDRDARRLALEAVREGTVDILVSDGPSEAMKGFGDTRDNIPALLDLMEEGALSPTEVFGLMTANPARLFAKITGQEWWIRELGSLLPGTRADIAVVNPDEREVVFTFVSGRLVAIEGRVVRTGYGAGGWVTRFGIVPTMGVGEMALGRVALPDPNNEAANVVQDKG